MRSRDRTGKGTRGACRNRRVVAGSLPLSLLAFLQLIRHHEAWPYPTEGFAMNIDPVSRKLIVVSLLIAFGLGVMFAAVGLRLRPRVALAPAPPRSAPEPVIAANDTGSGAMGHIDAEAERSANAVEDGRVAPGIVDLEDGLPDSVPGNGTATPPEGYPIKAKQRSGLYHTPGGLPYNRTIADMHFRTVDAAEAAGYTPSKA